MRNHLVLAALVPLLAACALGPKIPKPNTVLPVAYQSQPTPASADVPIDKWWTLYNDPQLQSLVEEALHNAPDARSAMARLEQAKAVRSSALSAFWPAGARPRGSTTVPGTTALRRGRRVIEFPTGPTTSIPINVANQGITDGYGGNFNVSWELDLFGRAAATRKKAKADLSVARFDFEASRTSLEANVADQLFQARGLAIQLEDAKQESEIERQLMDVAQKKAKFGFGATSDADEAGSQLAQSQAQVADLTTQLHAARRTLLVLIGHGGDPVDSLPTPVDVGTAPAIPVSVPAQLLARRPDVRPASGDADHPRRRAPTGWISWRAVSQIHPHSRRRLVRGLGTWRGDRHRQLDPRRRCCTTYTRHSPADGPDQGSGVPGDPICDRLRKGGADGVRRV